MKDDTLCFSNQLFRHRKSLFLMPRIANLLFYSRRCLKGYTNDVEKKDKMHWPCGLREQAEVSHAVQVDSPAGRQIWAWPHTHLSYGFSTCHLTLGTSVPSHIK